MQGPRLFLARYENNLGFFFFINKQFITGDFCQVSQLAAQFIDGFIRRLTFIWWVTLMK